MIIDQTSIAGLYVIEPERIGDERGYFNRTWGTVEAAAAGLAADFVQSSVSFNAKAHTLRGMHFQRDPHGETKLIRCEQGAVFDVIVDVRPDSPTFKQWLGFDLSGENGRQLYVSAGLAHGFQTLVDNTVVGYHIKPGYEPDAATGVRWDDPAFGIDWPAAPERIMSDRDREWPDHTAS